MKVIYKAKISDSGSSGRRPWARSKEEHVGVSIVEVGGSRAAAERSGRVSRV